MFRLSIKYDYGFFENLVKFIEHPIKKQKILDYNNINHSKKYFLSNEEYEMICGEYNNSDKKKISKNTQSIFSQMKKNKNLGVAGLEAICEDNLIDINKKNEILQRVFVKKIEKDLETENYFDIEVDKINNFYSGNFGLINIHNCGVGIDISTLRPNGVGVKNAANTTTGAVSFMERFSNTTREVGQNNRRGALMITIDVRHPDVEQFITIKNDLKKVTGANISIKLNDEFMNAVKNNTTFTLRYPIDKPIEDSVVKKEVNALKIWNLIIKSAHKSAEPGIIFWDNQHWYSTSSTYPDWENITTNPCSEIAMNNDSCRLMVVNYFNYVKNPFTKDSYFDFNELSDDVCFAQRLMDDLVDLELESVEKIIDKVKSDPEPDYIKNVELKTWNDLYENGKNGRRTGLGFTGLGDAIAALGLKYDSDEGIEMIEKISETKFISEFNTSIDMAIERGKFKDFNVEHENKSLFVKMIKNEYPDIYDRMMKHGRRNISISTVAPTGSLSILTQTTSGIEPAYQIMYMRRKKINSEDKTSRVDFIDDMGDSWTEYPVFHHNFKLWMEINGYDVNNIVENWTNEQINELIKKSPYYGATSTEIDWIKRVDVQSKVQKYVTHSISSTVNLPNNVDVGVVSDIYMNAWEKKLKGITVYRDGSRDGVLISESEKKHKEEEQLFKDNHAPKRPKRLPADIIRFQNNHEKWIAVVGKLDGRPYEIFTGKYMNGISELPQKIDVCEVVKNKITDENGVKKSRYDIEYIDGDEKITLEGISHKFNPEYWNYAKILSSNLRHGMPLIYVVELIQSLNLDDTHLNTWKNGVTRVLKRYIKDGNAKGTCPNCGSENLEYVEGCLTCRDCGHGNCG
jgi:ribonucleoside-diphosphate reductase alpha chain